MIIAIPINKKDINAPIADSFGRAVYFLFYNTETKEEKYEKNPALESAGGAGIKAAQVIADGKAAVLLTIRAGENAAGVLWGAGIKIYKAEPANVTDIIKSYLNEELPELIEAHSGFHGKTRKV